MADFLQDLRARGAADLNAVCATLNEGSLVRETLRYWIDNRWIVVAPNTSLLALTGSGFSRRLTLRQFCGAEDRGQEVSGGTVPESREDKEAHSDDNP